MDDFIEKEVRKILQDAAKNSTILNEEEIEKLIMQLAKGSGVEGFSEGDIDKVFNWAIETRLRAALLSMLLVTEVVIRVNSEGEILFSLPK